MLALQDERVLLLHYEDLKADLPGCVDRIIRHLGLELSPAQLETALSRMSFEYMSRNAELFHPRSVVWTNPSFRFIRKGQVGDHSALFQPRHHERFERMVAERFQGRQPPDLILQKLR